MYESSFGLTEAPFSISPDPRYLYMSQRHQEAMAHLRYGIQEAGGFVQLTGEVGTGKTTVCRCMLEQLPDNVDVALILNPQISHSELLATLCDEIGVSYPPNASPKQMLNVLNERLIESFSRGRRTVLVIDEAQILTRAVLEQIRILTNLETTKQKLLQIILIGQPELNTTISRSDLRQLSQRITARYHLEPLMRNETAEYIKYRLAVAGCHRPVFTRGAMRRVYSLSRGVPRLINVICDRALLGAYSSNSTTVTTSMMGNAGREVFGREPSRRKVWWWISGLAVASALAVAILRPHWIPIKLPGFETVRALSGGGSSVTAPGVGEKAGSDVKKVDVGTGTGKQNSDPVPAVGKVNGQSTKTENHPPSPTPVDSLGVSGERAGEEDPLARLLHRDALARGESEALSQLLDTWGAVYRPGSNPSCESIEASYGLRCLKERGTWEDLGRFNRVAALALRYRDTPAYVVVTAMDEYGVTIVVRGGVYHLTRAQVDQYWSGHYVLLWRVPPRGADTIAEHSEGVDVLWLRQTLSRVTSLEPSDIDNASYDALLKEKVMAFQKSNNLQVDGRAGAHTIMRLNSIVDPDVPKLQSASAG